jgi:hypothetical protein
MAMPSEAATIVENFLIANIRRDRDVQVRKALDEKAVEEYKDLILAGELPPPVRLFYDGTDYWLSRGFHRVEAMLKADGERIAAEVKQGTRRDAILDCIGANADNGVRLTNDEKRRAVKRLLSDEEWSRWSDREIARHVRVSNNLVSETRRSLSSDDSDRASERKVYVDRHGKKTMMRTGALGKASRLRVVREEDSAAQPEPAIPSERTTETESSEVVGEPLPIVASPALASAVVEPRPPESDVSPVAAAPTVEATPPAPARRKKPAGAAVTSTAEPSRQALAGKVRQHRNANKDVEKAIKEALKLIDGKAAMQIRFVEVQVFLRNALKRLKEVS